jgi:hypothetical protein
VLCGSHEFEERSRWCGRRRRPEVAAAALRRELLPRPALHRQVIGSSIASASSRDFVAHLAHHCDGASFG